MVNSGAVAATRPILCPTFLREIGAVDMRTWDVRETLVVDSPIGEFIHVGQWHGEPQMQLPDSNVATSVPVEAQETHPVRRLGGGGGGGFQYDAGRRVTLFSPPQRHAASQRRETTWRTRAAPADVATAPFVEHGSARRARFVLSTTSSLIRIRPSVV
jgi:hypothetical protein